MWKAFRVSSIFEMDLFGLQLSLLRLVCCRPTCSGWPGPTRAGPTPRGSSGCGGRSGRVVTSGTGNTQTLRQRSHNHNTELSYTFLVTHICVHRPLCRYRFAFIGFATNFVMCVGTVDVDPGRAQTSFHCPGSVQVLQDEADPLPAPGHILHDLPVHRTGESERSGYINFVFLLLQSILLKMLLDYLERPDDTVSTGITLGTVHKSRYHNICKKKQPLFCTPDVSERPQLF